MALVNLIKIIDKTIGTPLCFIIGLFKKKQSPYLETCFVQLWGIGESVLTLPAIKKFKENNALSKITIITTQRNSKVFEEIPYIDKIQIIEMNPLKILIYMLKNYKKYDMAFDMEEYLNISTLITLFISKVSIGFNHGQRSKIYTITREYNDKRYVAEVFCDLVGVQPTTKLEKISTEPELYQPTPNPSKKNIGIFFGTAESSKQRMWPIELWEELIEKLVNQKHKVFIFYGPNEQEINIKGTTNIRKDIHKLAWYCTKLNLFISNDTGPLHIAAAMNCPTIALFGPNIPIRWAPRGKKHTTLYHKQYCSPCIDSKTGHMQKCYNPIFQKCMKRITVEEVMSNVEKLL